MPSLSLSALLRERLQDASLGNHVTFTREQAFSLLSVAEALETDTGTFVAALSLLAQHLDCDCTSLCWCAHGGDELVRARELWEPAVERRRSREGGRG